MIGDKDFNWTESLRNEKERLKEKKRRRDSGRILFKRLMELGAVDSDADKRLNSGGKH